MSHQEARIDYRISPNLFPRKVNAVWGRINAYEIALWSYTPKNIHRLPPCPAPDIKHGISFLYFHHLYQRCACQKLMITFAVIRFGTPRRIPGKIAHVHTLSGTCVSANVQRSLNAGCAVARADYRPKTAARKGACFFQVPYASAPSLSSKQARCGAYTWIRHAAASTAHDHDDADIRRLCHGRDGIGVLGERCDPGDSLRDA